MLGNGAEGAAAKAAAHNVDRVPDHVESGNHGIAVDAVGLARVRQLEHAVEFVGAERYWRCVQPDVAIAMSLHQGTGVVRIGFLVQDARRVGIQRAILLYLLVAGNADHGGARILLPIEQAHRADLALRIVRRCALGATGLRARIDIRIDRFTHRADDIDVSGVDDTVVAWWLLADKGRTAQIADVADVLASGEAVRYIDDGALCVAVEQEVGSAVQKNRTAHLVAPVVVVGDAAQAGLDAADYQRYIAEGFPYALAVDHDRTVGSLAAFVAGCVGVIVAAFPVGGVAVDH